MRTSPWRKQSEASRDPGTSSLRRLRDEVDHLFSSFFGSPRWTELGGPDSSGGWTPDIEFIEGEKDFTVRAEVPGLDPKDIEVNLKGNTLTISGERKSETQVNKDRFHHSERRYGSFFRSIELPADTKPESISAEYDKGVLTLTIAKAESAKPQRIPVKSAGGSGSQDPEADMGPKE